MMQVLRIKQSIFYRPNIFSYINVTIDVIGYGLFRFNSRTKFIARPSIVYSERKA